ncbi:leucine-rich repeat-containing protein 47-like [Anoplophora glabripennis]|uniref:leucine-rich repeat-containing protein 47-like n=1 Tax=Anoplophora glabripennis TaxID=217634 RepID=UPI000873BA72|nr:leucine-rich repeat-containing protein 47-like [Anoplophora glabripennis]
MWPEVEKAKNENRHEIILTGGEISQRIEKNGLDLSVFNLIGLNFLNISDTILNTIPDEIAKLTNLQTLLLHSNKLEEINESLCRLDKLKTLDLSRNAIKVLPDTLANLLHLVTLNISGNKLENFPALSKNSKLSVLDLSNNKLKSFPQICSEELANLSELKLHGNEIEEIPNTISSLPALKLFDISSNKIKVIPGELSDCHKLKEINLKSNPIADRRLFKLIDQCRTKQVLDYVKQHCTKSAVTTQVTNSKSKNKKGMSKSIDEVENEVNTDYKYSINVKHVDENFKVLVMNAVKNVREHFAACILHNVKFNEESFKKFIQLQNKLHDTICDKRNTATIATHDFNKIPSGNLTYTTSPPNDLLITPLNRTTAMTGAELFNKLQTEANNLRKEKKRNTYSGIHKYLYLIEGKPLYPCLLNEKNEVISFPPITNSDISKIEVGTTKIFVEVTSSVSQFVCKNVLDTLLKEMVLLFGKDLDVQQVKTVDHEDHLKVVYPSKTDLNFEVNVPIKIVRG